MTLRRMILLLDNYDSFVHNLARYFRQAGRTTRVIRSDAIDLQGIRALAPSAIVLSPGPKGPESAGCCVDVARCLSDRVPVLGICLGHQAILAAFGAQISPSAPAHGIDDQIHHNGSRLFQGCPSPMTVGRYHSLSVVRESIPDEFRVTSQTDDGIVMSIEHCDRPLYGVQFHPESVLTEFGGRLIENFVAITDEFSSVGDLRQPCGCDASSGHWMQTP